MTTNRVRSRLLPYSRFCAPLIVSLFTIVSLAGAGDAWSIGREDAHTHSSAAREDTHSHAVTGQPHSSRAAEGAASVTIDGSQSAAPVIDVWYGLTQSFGTIGQPQPWVNILGNAAATSSLSYTLNGGPSIPLSMGVDGRRLLNAGDFNIDIHVSNLNAGANTVVINANGTTETVTVNYTPGTTWPGSYTICWDDLTDQDEIQDVAQVVDGKWILQGDEVRTAPFEWGYDRLIGIGDQTWQDYEVLVPITVHDWYANHGFGVLLRWNGHTDNPVVCPQPHCGWFPLGGLLWYEIGCLKVYGNFGEVLDEQCFAFQLGVKYWMRGRVETNIFGGLYKCKLWQDGQPEPANWTVIGQEQLTDPQIGSMLLLAHQSEVSFGKVVITELTPPPNQPPVAHTDRQYITSSGNVAIDVLRNDTDLDGFIDPTSVTIVDQPDHGNCVVDPVTGVVTYTHNGSPNPTDYFTYTIKDDDDMTSNEGGVEITITATPQPEFFSDDYNRCELDGSLWTFYSWLGDCTHAMTGAGTGDATITFSVPGNRTHDVWGINGLNESAHIMQLANDDDFSLHVKFNTEPQLPWQNQGLLVWQDSQNFARFDVFMTDFGLNAHIGSTVNGNNTAVVAQAAAPGSTYYLRVDRNANIFTMYHSADGTNWTYVADLGQTMTVTQVGVYAANPVVAVAYDCEVDFFMHTDVPLPSEDAAQNDIQVVTSGMGSVTATPNPGPYSCDDVVALEAFPDVGWSFVSWSGDASGTDNPTNVTVTGPMNVTATFETATAVGDGVPEQFELVGAHPNPFNPTTRIFFRTAATATVSLSIYDVSGRLVRTLVNREMTPGEHAAAWDGRDNSGAQVGTGVYFYSLTAGDFRASKKLVLLK